MRIEAPMTITPSQTVGPFYAYCLTPDDYQTIPPIFGRNLATDDAVGQRISISGTLIDGDDHAIPDGMIELWQPDGNGNFVGAQINPRKSSFTGFGRTHCNESGSFTFHTVKPGRVPTSAGILQAPHVALSIFGKGMNRRLYTRIYFADEVSNDEDPILALLSSDERATLIAEKIDDAAFHITIRLQGQRETVFFEV